MNFLISILLAISMSKSIPSISTKQRRTEHRVTTTSPTYFIAHSQTTESVSTTQTIIPEDRDFQPDANMIDPSPDLEMIVNDPNEFHLDPDGKISFSHFSRLMFLAKSTNKIFNFVAKIFPSADPKITDTEMLTQNFDALKNSQQIYYIMFHDNEDFGKELDLLFDQAKIIDFTFRDAINFFGLDQIYSEIYKSQNPGGELFVALKRGIESDVQEFKLTMMNMLKAINYLRNGHKFLYNELKFYESDYSEPGNLETTNDKINQGQKMLTVFLNLKIQIDSMLSDLIVGVENGFQMRAKISTKLKKMAIIDKMTEVRVRELLDEYKPEEPRELVNVFMTDMRFKIMGLGFMVCLFIFK